MAGKQTIQEMDFAQFVSCPLRVQAAGYADPPELQAAQSTAAWLMRTIFADQLPTLAAVREFYEADWKQASGLSPYTATERKRVLRLIPRASRRLHDLAVDYLVAHPVTPYTLSFGRNAVRGEYAVLQRARKKAEPFVLRLRLGANKETEIRHRGPDTVNMLRWVHFRQWEPGNPMVQVLNYALDVDEAWTDFYDEPVVRGYLHSAAANLADKRFYPIPGMHCESCKVPVCVMDAMEVFPIHG